jgi:hypothetical protein
VKGEGGTSHRIVEADGLRWEITLPLNAGGAGASRKRTDPAKEADRITTKSLFVAVLQYRTHGHRGLDDERGFLD